MTLTTGYVLVAILATLLWLPLFIRFYRAFVRRGNPISLGVAGTIMLVMWTTIAGLWAVSEAVSSGVVLFTSALASTFVAGFTHFAFYWSDRKFKNTRGNTNGDE